MAGLRRDGLGVWPGTQGGADVVAEVGVGQGTNLSELGAGDAVLIIASDIEEEAPLWRLRLKQAADRGAYLVVANARKTRMDKFADERLRYGAGMAAHIMHNLQDEYPDTAKKLADAKNLVIVAGAEGLTLEGSSALMQSAANFLITTKHAGKNKPNNGLLATFPGPNAMGQYYLGYTPEETLKIAAKPPKVLIVAQADILLDDPSAKDWLEQVETVISLNLFDDTVPATISLPIQSFAERDGSFVNGERRVQRFYAAQGPLGQVLPAWQILSRIGEKMEQGRAKLSAAAVMNEIAKNVEAFEGMGYGALADDGVQIASSADNGKRLRGRKVALPDMLEAENGQLLIVPTTRLYNREKAFEQSELVHPRILPAYIELNGEDAENMGISCGDTVEVTVEDISIRVSAAVNGAAPKGTAFLPRHLAASPAPLTMAVGEVKKVDAASAVEA